MLAIVATPINLVHTYTSTLGPVLMRITGLVEIVNITLCRRLQMLGAHRVCAIENSSYEMQLHLSLTCML